MAVKTNQTPVPQNIPQNIVSVVHPTSGVYVSCKLHRNATLKNIVINDDGSSNEPIAPVGPSALHVELPKTCQMIFLKKNLAEKQAESPLEKNQPRLGRAIKKLQFRFREAVEILLVRNSFKKNVLKVGSI